MKYAEINNDSNTIIRELDLFCPPPEHKYGLNKLTRIIPIVDGVKPNFNSEKEFLSNAENIVFEDRVEKQWIINVIPPPEQVPLWAFRAILTIMGLSSQIDQMIADLPEPNKTIANVQWYYGNYIERNHPLIDSLGAQLGLTKEQIDNVFFEANKLK